MAVDLTPATAPARAGTEDRGGLRFSASYADLMGALADLKPFLAGKRARTVTRCVRLVRGTPDEVVATVYDWHTVASVRIPAQRVEGTVLVLSFVELTDALRGCALHPSGRGRRPAAELAATPVFLSGPDEPGAGARLGFAEQHATLQTHEVAEHPGGEGLHLPPSWTGPLQTSRAQLGHALRAVGTDETLPRTTVVALRCDQERGGELVATATDRYRLAETRIAPSVGWPADLLPVHGQHVLFPGRVLARALQRFGRARDAGRLLGIGSQAGDLDVGGSWATVASGPLTVTTRPVEDSAIATDPVWPRSVRHSATVDRRALADALDQAAVAARAFSEGGGLRCALLEFRDGALDLVAQIGDGSQRQTVAAIPATTVLNRREGDRLVGGHVQLRLDYAIDAIAGFGPRVTVHEDLERSTPRRASGNVLVLDADVGVDDDRPPRRHLVNPVWLD